jgi:DNA-binding transcriptional ArsR family regulator
MAHKKAGGKKTSSSAKSKASDRAQQPVKGRPKWPSRGLINCSQMQALSNEDRVKIFAILCECVASPKEISVELNGGLSQVSYHVSVLQECRLIVLDHKVPRRGTIEHFYRAAVPTLVPPDAWTSLPPAVRKTISLGILQEFFDDAFASVEAGVFDSPPGELSWTPLILDAAGVEEFGQLARDFLESVLKLQANTSKRLPKGNGKVTDVTSATVFMASFLSARDPKDGRKASGAKRR